MAEVAPRHEWPASQPLMPVPRYPQFFRGRRSMYDAAVALRAAALRHLAYMLGRRYLSLDGLYLERRCTPVPVVDTCSVSDIRLQRLLRVMSDVPSMKGTEMCRARLFASEQTGPAPTDTALALNVHQKEP